MRPIDKQYILDVKKRLPAGKSREALLKNLYESVHTYCEERPSANLDELYKLFGTPDEIAESFEEASSSSSKPADNALTMRVLFLSAVALAAVCIIALVSNRKGTMPSEIVNGDVGIAGSSLSADASSSDAYAVPDGIGENTSRPLGDYEKYDIYHVGDIITYRIPEGGEYPATDSNIEAYVSENGEEIGQTVEYSVKDAVLYDNLESSGLTQEDLDRICSSSEAGWIQDKSSCHFAVITLNVKYARKEGVQNLAQNANILNLTNSFHLLTYALLDKGLNYDPVPLVWYKSDDASSQGIFSSPQVSDKTETETEYRIGFVLSDMTNPQDGLLLHIGSDTDSSVYVDLGVNGCQWGRFSLTPNKEG